MWSMRATACLVALVSWRTVLAVHKGPASTDATQDVAEAAALLANASRPRVRAALTTFIDAEPLPKRLFLVLQIARSGSDWLLSLLNNHTDICIPCGPNWKDFGLKTDHHALVGLNAFNFRARDPNYDLGAHFSLNAHKRLAEYKPGEGASVAGWKEGLSLSPSHVRRPVFASTFASPRSPRWPRDAAAIAPRCPAATTGRQRHDAAIASTQVTAAQLNTFARWIRAHQVKLILLRRDTLGRVVSDAYNNTVHCTTGACVKANNRRTVYLDPTNTLYKLKKMEVHFDTVEAWCQSEVPKLTHLVSYDDLSANTQDRMDEIFKFLGVKKHVAVSAMRKAGGALKDTISNLDAVRAALKGTRWFKEIE
mmetsp:Transcript_18243/g.56990  ORF Transcript_18243/g.56990 Transcript_18243/m.56990 type:complete len:366 (-) Transcript_18243:109-1206(-)